MLCNGACQSEDKTTGCGLFWTITFVNDETKEELVESMCAFAAIHATLTRLEQRMMGVQQSTEGHRNNEAEVADLLLEELNKGFKRLAKAALLKDAPHLAILED